MKLNPISKIKADLGIEANGRVHSFLTNTCYKHMDKYVPRDSGALRENVDIKTDSITYQSPYAHYQYIGKMYVMDNGKAAYFDPDYGWWSKPGARKMPTDKDLQYKTSGTGPYWDKRMVSAEMSEVTKEVQNYVKGNK